MNNSAIDSKYEPIDALELCPHCAKMVRIDRYADHLAGNGYLLILCCATMTENFILDQYNPKKEDSEKFARSKLIAKWNTRHNENQFTAHEIAQG